MKYGSKSYQIETPTVLWQQFKQLHADRDRINSRVAELIAQDVRDQADGTLEPQVRREVNRVLGSDES